MSLMNIDNDAGLAKSGHGATSGDAAKFGGAEGASSQGDVSVRSLSRGSLSMVLCEDFGTALCDADDLDEALPPPEKLEEAVAGLPGICPEESASKRRRSAEATDPSHGESCPSLGAFKKFFAELIASCASLHL